MTPKSKADSIIKSLGISTPEDIDIELIANYFDISVRKIKLEGSAARLTSVKNSARIAISNAEKYEPRIRFSIAHELGHFFLHRSQQNLFSCTSESIMFDWSKNKIEAEANSFAANLLMPEHIFRTYLVSQRPSIKLFMDISNIFSTSISATLIRNIECTPEPCTLICSQAGKILWSKNSKDFKYYIKPRGATVDKDTYAYDCFTTRDGCLEGDVPTDAWLEDSRVDPDSTIYEYAFSIPGMNMVYSLLWVDKEIEHYSWE